MSISDDRTTPVEVVTSMLFIWLVGALVLTAALVVVGGGYVLGDPTVRIVLGAMLVAVTVYLVRQHRHRAEILHDRRLHEARERRGF